MRIETRARRYAGVVAAATLVAMVSFGNTQCANGEPSAILAENSTPNVPASWEYTGPPNPEKALSRERPIRAYDWILHEKIRGIYMYSQDWKNEGLLDHISAAGFNTILVFPRWQVHSEDAWPKEAAAWAQVKQQRHMHIFIAWDFGGDTRYTNTQYGAFAPGNSTVWTHTPPPEAAEYWKHVIGDRAVIAAQAGLDGFLVDPEMYGSDKTFYPGPSYDDLLWSKFVRAVIPGFAGSGDPVALVPVTERKDWVAQHGLAYDYEKFQEHEVAVITRNIRNKVDTINRDFILGNLSGIETIPGMAIGFGTEDRPALIFTEETYGNDSGLRRSLDTVNKAADYNALLVPGIWIKPYTPPRLPGAMAEYANAPGSAGYWIWSSQAFVPAGPEYQHAAGYSDDDYWTAIRQGNERLRRN